MKNIKKVISLLLTILITVNFAVVSPVLAGEDPFTARGMTGKDISDSIVKDIIVETKDGEFKEGDTLYDGERFNFKLTFEGNKKGGERNIKHGDYITINLISDEIAKLTGVNTETPIKFEGKVLGTLIVEDSTAILVFEDVVDTLYNIEGYLEFFIEARNLKDTTEESIDSGFIKVGEKEIEIPILKPESGEVFIDNYKTGNLPTDDTKHVTWYIRANLTDTKPTTDIHLFDKVLGGQEIVWDSFSVSIDNTGDNPKTYSGEGWFEELLKDYPGTEYNKNEINNSFDFKFIKDEIGTKDIDIQYKTKVTNPFFR